MATKAKKAAARKPAVDETPEQTAERLAAEAAEKEASKAPRTEPKDNETEAKAAQRIAEEGTGTAEPDKGYHGSGDHQDGGNYYTDPGQVSNEELRRDRAAQRESNT